MPGNSDADWQERPTSELTLTIVGIYGYNNPNIIAITRYNPL